MEALEAKAARLSATLDLVLGMVGVPVPVPAPAPPRQSAAIAQSVSSTGLMRSTFTWTAPLPRPPPPRVHRCELPFHFAQLDMCLQQLLGFRRDRAERMQHKWRLALAPLRIEVDLDGWDHSCCISDVPAAVDAGCKVRCVCPSIRHPLATRFGCPPLPLTGAAAEIVEASGGAGGDGDKLDECPLLGRSPLDEELYLWKPRPLRRFVDLLRALLALPMPRGTRDVVNGRARTVGALQAYDAGCARYRESFARLVTAHLRARAAGYPVASAEDAE